MSNPDGTPVTLPFVEYRHLMSGLAHRTNYLQLFDVNLPVHVSLVRTDQPSRRGSLLTLESYQDFTKSYYDKLSALLINAGFVSSDSNHYLSDLDFGWFCDLNLQDVILYPGVNRSRDIIDDNPYLFEIATRRTFTAPAITIK